MPKAAARPPRPSGGSADAPRRAGRGCARRRNRPDPARFADGDRNRVGRQDDHAEPGQLEHVLECSAEKGVSRGTRISLRPSLMTTSAARSIRFCASPAATAASVPMVHGQTTIASGGLEPEASGANHSSRPNTRNWPAAAPKRRDSSASTSAAARQRQVHLLPGDDLRHLRVEQLHRGACADQAFHKPDAVGHARGAGQATATFISRPPSASPPPVRCPARNTGRPRRRSAPGRRCRRAAPATAGRRPTGRRCGERRGQAPAYRAEPASGQMPDQTSAARLATEPARLRKNPGARNCPSIRLPATTRSSVTQTASAQP